MMPKIEPGTIVHLTGFGPGCIIPDGEHIVSRVNADGSFHVGGRTAVWPHRIAEIKAKTPRVGGQG